MISSGLYAHEDELLEDHLSRVNKSASTILERYKPCFSSPKLYNDFKLAIDTATKFHDIGKATHFFQTYLLTEEKVDSRKKTHSLISALACLFYIKSTRITFNNPYFDFFTYLSIKRHHGNFVSMREERVSFLDEKSILLEQIDSIDRQKFRQLSQNIDIQFNLDDFGIFIEKKLNKVKREFHNFTTFLRKEKSISFYVYLNLIFSFLLSADKTQTAMPNRKERRALNIPNNIVNEYKNLKFRDTNGENRLNILREEIYRQAGNSIYHKNDKRILSLNVPTGTGKTLAVFNVAINLRNRIVKEKGYTPKVIYALPFITVIDQNSEEFGKILKHQLRKKPTSDILLYHHSLAKTVYTESEKNPETELNDDEADQEVSNDQMGKSQLLIELWESDFVFTTFVQLCNTLFSNRNKNLKRFHSLIGSIIILDEVQNIPRKYWGLVKKTLHFLSEEFSTYFIFMTATLPLIFDSNEMRELVSQKEKYFKSMSRINLHYNLDEALFSQFKKRIIKTLNKKKSYLFVLNTIRSSQELFKHFGSKQIKKQFDIFYLSTRLIPKHRLKKIQKIKDELRNKNRKKGIIVVSTQLIEAGIDLDFDVVYRDFAPLDSINQTAGRCNRDFGLNKKGNVFVVNLVDDIGMKDKNKAKLRRFCKYIYDSVLLDATEETLKEFPEKIAEKYFYRLNQKYFEKVRKRVSDEYEWIQNMQLLNYRSDNGYSISKFSLIQQSSFRVVDLFIIPAAKADRMEAVKIWRSWKNLKNYKGFKCKHEFQKFKHKFSQYKISVPVNNELVYALNLSYDQYFAKWDSQEMQVATNFKYDEVIGFYFDREDSQNII